MKSDGRIGSNWGAKSVDIYAPGKDINSTYIFEHKLQDDDLIEGKFVRYDEGNV